MQVVCLTAHQCVLFVEVARLLSVRSADMKERGVGQAAGATASGTMHSPPGHAGERSVVLADTERCRLLLKCHVGPKLEGSTCHRRRNRLSIRRAVVWFQAARRAEKNQRRADSPRPSGTTGTRWAALSVSERNRGHSMRNELRVCHTVRVAKARQHPSEKNK